MEPEVLVYINKLKNYLKTNKEARSYFLGDLDEEEFFEKVEEHAIKNFIDKGDPTLTMDQFEYIKKLMNLEEITNRKPEYYEPIIFIDDRGLEIIKKSK